MGSLKNKEHTLSDTRTSTLTSFKLLSLLTNSNDLVAERLLCFTGKQVNFS